MVDIGKLSNVKYLIQVVMLAKKLLRKINKNIQNCFSQILPPQNKVFLFTSRKCQKFKEMLTLYSNIK